MTISRRRLLTGAAAGAAGVAGLPHIWIKNMDYAWAEDAKEIKVGVLYSLTGTTATIEKSMSQVTKFAIEQINKAGGVLGRKVVPIVEDPASDPKTFSEKANKLVVGDKVPTVFGSYTSASRKAVLPVFEKRNNLYWYPTYYEGFECSKNVIYTGAVPNQQQANFVPWIIKNLNKKKFFIVGSNYIYPRDGQGLRDPA
jgi:urea transport system substrate-binding protein